MTKFVIGDNYTFEPPAKAPLLHFDPFTGETKDCGDANIEKAKYVSPSSAPEIHFFSIWQDNHSYLVPIRISAKSSKRIKH